MDGISVIICCYNSADRLAGTLQYLAKQKTSQLLSWELIIVDNASTDRTVEVVKNLWGQSNIIPLKIIYEPKPGLSFARKSGIKISSYDSIIFCDDDNYLFEDYLDTAKTYFDNYPQFGAFGGQGFFLTENLPKEIIKNQLVFAVGPQSNRSKDITIEKGYVYGAGMCIRKDAFNKSNTQKSILTDRVGNQLSSGGDTEICLNLILSGYKIGYFEDLKFYHAIPLIKLNVKYIRKFFIDTAKESYLLDGLQYKAKIHQKMFNKRYKKSWLIKLVRELFFLPHFDTIFDFKTVVKIKFFRIKKLIELNFKYDKSFR